MLGKYTADTAIHSLAAVASRALIITADDLGLTPEINDAVMAGYDAGVITSAGVRVGARAADAAIVSATMRPGLGMGLHLVLCDGNSTLSPRHIPHLVDASGRFVERPLEAVWLYRRAGGLREALKAEIRAQIEKFLSSGLYLTHISGHFNLHLHPTVMSILVELAANYPISAVRKPCGGLWRWSLPPLIPAWERWVEGSFMRPMLGWGRLKGRAFLGPRRVEPLGLELPLTEDAISARVAGTSSGVTELICHPASQAPCYDGVGEAAIVTSSRVRQALDDGDAELISYRDIAEGFEG